MKKIVLIGAGSTVFGLGTISDIFKSSILSGVTISLHDIDAKSLKRTKEIAEKFKNTYQGTFIIESTTDRAEALKGADFCIISIEVGKRFELWEQDWKIPLQYGFKQIYGENGGPGGLFHSLRIIPPILEICADINEICPEALVINYSNPMQRVCHAVVTKYPHLKFIGLCHEIASMGRQLPALMETDISNICFKAGGLNHLSILIEATYKNTNRSGYSIIRKKFGDYYSQVINQYDDYHKSKPGAERGVFRELFNNYNFLPITTDSHLGEYMPWAHSVADHHAINEFYNNYKSHCLKTYGTDFYQNRFFDPRRPMYERVIPIIEGIVEHRSFEESAVNVPNNNFIDSVPNGIVVEVPGIVNKNGVTGVRLEKYPSSFGLLLNNQTGVIQLTTEAVLSQSKDNAFLALLADPIVDNSTSAASLLKTMLILQEEHLGYLQ